MKLRNLLAATAALGLLASASASSAAIVVASAVADALNTYSGVLLDNFDGYVDPSVSYVGNTTSVVFPNSVSNSAPPPYSGGPLVCCNSSSAYYNSDDTTYASVQGSGIGTLTVLSGYLTSFSFYMGSPDTYNQVVFHIIGSADQVFNGTEIWDGPNMNGDRDKGYRVSYNFNGAKVSGITFTSGQDAFEFDNLAGTLAVPEPASWALMILGFGGVGAALRSRRKLAIA
jgi:hypothetical protein